MLNVNVYSPFKNLKKAIDCYYKFSNGQTKIAGFILDRMSSYNGGYAIDYKLNKFKINCYDDKCYYRVLDSNTNTFMFDGVCDNEDDALKEIEQKLSH